MILGYVHVVWYHDLRGKGGDTKTIIIINQLLVLGFSLPNHINWIRMVELARTHFT